jgi:integrase
LPIASAAPARVRRLSLGQFPDVSLEAARDRANELTRAARAGHDLIAECAAAKIKSNARLTIGDLIDLYLRRCVEGKLRTAKEIEKRLKRALAPIANRYPEEIRRRDIRELLDAAADRGVEREAEKQRQTIGAMFRWALAQDFIEIDPTAGLSAYDPGQRRDRVLSPDEIRILWAWLDTSKFPRDYADVLRLQLAIGARCGEVAGMCAEELDRKNWIWKLPAERSKNKRP